MLIPLFSDRRLDAELNEQKSKIVQKTESLVVSLDRGRGRERCAHVSVFLPLEQKEQADRFARVNAPAAAPDFSSFADDGDAGFEISSEAAARPSVSATAAPSPSMKATNKADRKSISSKPPLKPAASGSTSARGSSRPASAARTGATSAGSAGSAASAPAPAATAPSAHFLGGDSSGLDAVPPNDDGEDDAQLNQVSAGMHERLCVEVLEGCALRGGCVVLRLLVSRLRYYRTRVNVLQTGLEKLAAELREKDQKYAFQQTTSKHANVCSE